MSLEASSVPVVDKKTRSRKSSTLSVPSSDVISTVETPVVDKKTRSRKSSKKEEPILSEPIPTSSDVISTVETPVVDKKTRSRKSSKKEEPILSEPIPTSSDDISTVLSEPEPVVEKKSRSRKSSKKESVSSEAISSSVEISVSSPDVVSTVLSEEASSVVEKKTRSRKTSKKESSKKEETSSEVISRVEVVEKKSSKSSSSKKKVGGSSKVELMNAEELIRKLAEAEGEEEEFVVESIRIDGRTYYIGVTTNELFDNLETGIPIGKYDYSTGKILPM